VSINSTASTGIDSARESRSRFFSVKHWPAMRAWFEAWSFLAWHAPSLSITVKGEPMKIEDLLPPPGDEPTDVPGDASDPEFETEFPRMWTLCSAPVDGTGKKRQTSTLVFFLDAGSWKVRLSERNVCLDLWGGGATFRAALAHLEAQLSKSPVPWRRPTVTRKR